MFETDDFQKKLTDAVVGEAGRSQMKTYDPGIVTYLVRLAVANEAVLLESENKRPATERRGIDSALRSARTLLEHASGSARAAGRTNVTLEDVRASYIAKFCQVWPFCK